MVTDVRPVEEHVALPVRIDACDEADPLFMKPLHLLDQRSLIPPAILLLVELSVTSVTDKNEVLGGVQLVFRHPFVAAWPRLREGVNVTSGRC